MVTLPRAVMPTSQISAYADRTLSSVGQGRSLQPAFPSQTSFAPSMGSRTLQNRQTSTMPTNIRQGASAVHNARMQALQRRQESAGMAGLGGVAGHGHGSGTFNLSGNVKLPANYGNPNKAGWRAPSGGWGGAYGLIPEAGAAWERLDAAFKKTFGYKIPVNSAFRSYAREKELWDLYQSGRGNLASRPGGSVHERGFAIDLGGAFQNASSREHRWLQANASRFGWNWAGKNFSQFEPWHWEYRGAR